jgi:hypothetical protein
LRATASSLRSCTPGLAYFTTWPKRARRFRSMGKTGTLRFSSSRRPSSRCG